VAGRRYENVPSRRRLSIFQTLSAPDVITAKAAAVTRRRLRRPRVTPTHRKHDPYSGPPGRPRHSLTL